MSETHSIDLDDLKMVIPEPGKDRQVIIWKLLNDGEAFRLEAKGVDHFVVGARDVRRLMAINQAWLNPEALLRTYPDTLFCYPAVAFEQLSERDQARLRAALADHREARLWRYRNSPEAEAGADRYPLPDKG